MYLLTQIFSKVGLFHHVCNSKKFNMLFGYEETIIIFCSKTNAKKLPLRFSWHVYIHSLTRRQHCTFNHTMKLNVLGGQGSSSKRTAYVFRVLRLHGYRAMH